MGLAPALAETLATTSFAVSEEGKEIVHFWIRKELESSASPGGIVGYDTLAEGTFVGVYEVKGESFTDFRGQDLPKGVYTLRVTSHPQDGNHMGVAPTPTFLCLVPAAEDKTLDPIERDPLMDLSKKAANTGHPTALYLEPFFEAPQATLPAVRKNDLEHIALDVATKAKLATETVDFPIAIVFIGVTEAE
jgi:hypothetical protein